MNRLAIYLRLSIEDKRRNSDGNFIQDESNSIKNQRKLILKYIHQDPDLAKYEVVEFNEM